MGLHGRAGWFIAASAGAAVVVGLVLAGSSPAAPGSDLTPYSESLPVKEMFARGIYQHFVETRFDVESIEIKRGQVVIVPFTIEHSSHVWWESAIVSRLGNKLANYLPSGQEIPVNDYLSYSPASVVLPSNSSSRASVTIVMPQDLPDEMISGTIKITASFEADYPITASDSAARKPGVLLIRILS